VIENRHPHLAIFYFEWRDIYETSFERQECHYGVPAPLSPQVEELVAWATEGFLMACWLALRDNDGGRIWIIVRYHFVKDGWRKNFCDFRPIWKYCSQHSFQPIKARSFLRSRLEGSFVLALFVASTELFTPVIAQVSIDSESVIRSKQTEM